VAKRYERPLRDPVRIRFDGGEVVAERGEPIASALIADGRWAVARSPKFHRPRGPACFRAACDGCLARVDGVPNVMTCRCPAEEGTVIEAQNTLGSREVDLLRVTDWFFPEGFNHHELFAGVPGAQQVMQVFARRIAGLGKLPKDAAKARAAERREVDVLVVGAGPAGILVALELAAKGRKVEIVDDGLEPGGSALATFDPAWDEPLAAFGRAVAESKITLRMRTTAGAVFGDDVLVVSEGGAEIIGPRVLVLATGAHDGVLAFEGNDIPGVISARAAGWLLRRGVVLGSRVVIAVADGGGPFGEAYARAVLERKVPCEVELVHEAPARAHGGTKLKAVTISSKEIKAQALLVDAPRAPSYELAEQAGATIVHEPRGFVVRAERGRVREGIFATGEVTGAPLALASMRAEAAALAAEISRR